MKCARFLKAAAGKSRGRNKLEKKKKWKEGPGGSAGHKPNLCKRSQTMTSTRNLEAGTEANEIRRKRKTRWHQGDFSVMKTLLGFI